MLNFVYRVAGLDFNVNNVIWCSLFSDRECIGQAPGSSYSELMMIAMQLHGKNH